MLPAKPACFGQVGRIRCACPDSGCTHRRYLWLHGQAVADMPSNEARRKFLSGLPHQSADAVRHIAMHILSESHA